MKHAVAILLLPCLASCGRPDPSIDLRYSGGLLSGSMKEDDWSLDFFDSYGECPDGLAAHTRVVAPDGAVIRLLDITPEYLLTQRGATCSSGRGNEVLCSTLQEFEPCNTYICTLNGGGWEDLTICISGGQVTSYATLGHGDPSKRVRFVSPSGSQFQMPLTKAQTIELWGVPERVIQRQY